ncbi:MAG TPA: hypothetical protein VLD19_15545, partial [Chitinophagaceae bacterium]|nr:hypothetical protein [Chitinophagaceae bacterium]
MQLYSGKPLSNGTIDWVNPVPLEHDLLSLDITKLNFYPPHYPDTLGTRGYNTQDKTFTDSLYFSFARQFLQPSVSEPASIMDYSPLMETNTKSGYSPKDTATQTVKKMDSTFSDYSYVGGDTSVIPTKADSFSRPCFINPAKIKAIWNTPFQHTLLSTREFEQRLVWIHKSGNNDVLDLYVENLDKNLCTIDSMAARMLGGELKARFLQFAARHDGKVKNGIRQLEKLRDYYQSKTLAYTEAITKTQNEFWQKQRQLDAVASGKQSAYRVKDMNRLMQNFEEELNLNMKDAYRQLGYDTTMPRVLPTEVYAFRVVNTGWCNVDRAVVASTLNRSTLDFTDSATGKKAVIHYNSIS